MTISIEGAPQPAALINMRLTFLSIRSLLVLEGVCTKCRTLGGLEVRRSVDLVVWLFWLIIYFPIAFRSVRSFVARQHQRGARACSRVAG